MKQQTMKANAGLIVATLLLALVPLRAQEIVVEPSRPDAVYGLGDKIEWHLELKASAADKITEAHYVLKHCGLTVMKEGTVKLSGGVGTVDVSMDEPGTILAEFTANVDGKEIKALGGAAVSPDQIKPSATCPEDFDAFWKSKIQELNQVPPNPLLESVDSGKPGVEYFKVRMDNIRGSHIYGQLAKPGREGKFPAVLMVQYAGVYGLPRENVIRRADAGWMALNIMAHDLPFDRDADYYKQAASTTLKDYVAIGNDDRDKSYFLRMYLACYRAVEYLASRTDWDGKTLVVIGTSQGGQQSIITAGLNQKVTAMIANVPGGCDITGPLLGRSAGFPYWINQGKWHGHEKQSTETGRYYDAVNFASRIRCPAMISMGLIDESCPPTGVLAAANQINGPKTVLIMPHSDHHGNHNAQAVFWSRSEQWLRELQKGTPAPPTAGVP